MSEVKLKYGLRDGKLISINDVPSGLACNCICPSCKAPLVAKKGTEREHHFAHDGSTDCNTGCESALHLMAKMILDSRKELFVPDELNKGNGAITAFSSVELECRDYPGVVPDAVMKNDEDLLCVEILVTHAVDDEKQKIITKAKLPTVEIDLSNLINQYDESIVTDALLSGKNTRWIFNSALEELWRRQEIVDELCDHIPEGYGNLSGRYYCPSQQRRVDFLYETHSCHECWYFNNRYSRDLFPPMPCTYRERDLLNQTIDNFKNIERKNGLIVSLDVLVNGEWQHWSGSEKDTLSRGQRNDTQPLHRDTSSIAGRTIYDLWKPEYSSMVVKKLTDGKVMAINGADGKMYRQNHNPNGHIMGKYSNNFNGKYRYSEYYPVWDADKPIWNLIRPYMRH